MVGIGFGIKTTKKASHVAIAIFSRKVCLFVPSLHSEKKIMWCNALSFL